MTVRHNCASLDVGSMRKMKKKEDAEKKKVGQKFSIGDRVTLDK